MEEKKKGKSFSTSSDFASIVVLSVITGLSALTNLLINYVQWWAFLINFVIVLLGILVSVFIRYKKLSGLEQSTKELATITGELQKASNTISASMDVYNYVYGSAKLRELEGSVGESGSIKNPIIYIRSTKFVLERTDSAFAQMLLNNLRKGVIYYYLIPAYENPHLYASFNRMVLDWWENYSSFLKSKDACKKAIKMKDNSWDSKYSEYLTRANTYWGKKDANPMWSKLIQDVFDLFKQRLVYILLTNAHFILSPLFIRLDEINGKLLKSFQPII